MKLQLVKTLDGKLMADGEESLQAINNIKSGDLIIVEYKPSRNYKFHKKLFGLLGVILENQSHYKTVDNILEMVKFKAGYFDTIVTHKGKKHYKTKSIAFENMDEVEFQKFYNSALDVAFELTGIDQQTYEQQIMQFV
jgi:hypothetical protein